MLIWHVPLLVEIGRSGIAHDLLLADHGLTES
jgi:hypothetical protein